jgi:hypothetical protein
MHVYESTLLLDAFHGPVICGLGVPLAATIYAMNVPKWVPRSGELVVGSQETSRRLDQFRAANTLIEPPVNTDKDDPAKFSGAEFRAEIGVRAARAGRDRRLPVEPDIKQEGIGRTIQAFRAARRPPAAIRHRGRRAELRRVAAQAAAANARLRRDAIIMTGSMEDPRARPTRRPTSPWAWAARRCARCPSASRSFVHGIQGFTRTFAPESYDDFMHTGFWGIGDGNLDVTPLAKEIRVLADNPDYRADLGRWSRVRGAAAVQPRRRGGQADRGVRACGGRATSACGQRLAEAARSYQGTRPPPTYSPTRSKDVVRPPPPPIGDSNEAQGQRGRLALRQRGPRARLERGEHRSSASSPRWASASRWPASRSGGVRHVRGGLGVRLLALLSFNELGVSLAIVRWPRRSQGDRADRQHDSQVAFSTLLYGVCFFLAPAFTSPWARRRRPGSSACSGVSVIISGSWPRRWRCCSAPSGRTAR